MVIGTVNSATMEINYEDMCILQFVNCYRYSKL